MGFYDSRIETTYLRHFLVKWFYPEKQWEKSFHKAVLGLKVG
jgi:hypothetical protein